MRSRLTLALAALLCAVWPTRAEEIHAGLTEPLIRITSNFTGAEIVFFGAISAEDTFATREGRDLVVVVRGPEANLTVRRKEQVAGIWINGSQATFTGLPAYYFIASTRPLAQITSQETLERYQLGLAGLHSAAETSLANGDVPGFRAAAVSARAAEGLYRELNGESAIEIIGNTLFQVKIPLPAEVPVGSYEAEAFLFRNGNVVSGYTSPFFIDKSGLERWLFEKAHDEPFFYGLTCVLLSIGAGWLATVIFQRA